MLARLRQNGISYFLTAIDVGNDCITFGSKTASTGIYFAFCDMITDYKN